MRIIIASIIVCFYFCIGKAKNMENSTDIIRLKIRNRAAVLMARGTVALLMVLLMPVLLLADLIVMIFNGNGFLYKIVNYLKSHQTP